MSDMSSDQNQTNLNLFQIIGAYMTQMGLGELFKLTNGTPSGWLWDQITSGVDDQAVIMLNMEQTQPFKTRYGIIGELRDRAAKGEPVHVPTVSEVREYEQTTSEIFRRADAPRPVSCRDRVARRAVVGACAQHRPKCAG